MLVPPLPKSQSQLLENCEALKNWKVALLSTTLFPIDGLEVKFAIGEGMTCINPAEKKVSVHPCAEVTINVMSHVPLVNVCTGED